MSGIDGKLRNMLLAHLDGVYVFSSRDDCDQLVTRLIHLLLDAKPPAQQIDAEVAARRMAEDVMYTPYDDLPDSSQQLLMDYAIAALAAIQGARR